MRRWATQFEVIEATVRRLRTIIPGYNDQNCFRHPVPIPDTAPGGRECCTVSPGSGEFVAALQTGGTIKTLVEDSLLTVTVMLKHDTDRPGRRETMLVDPARGLLTRKWDILRAMLAEDFDLFMNTTDGEDVRYLLREQLSVRRAGAIGEVVVGQTTMYGFQMEFHTPFDWPIVPLDYEPEPEEQA